MSQVGKFIRDLIFDQMKSRFNDDLDAAFNSYALDAKQVIGWDGIDWDGGSNFIFGRLGPNMIEQSTPFHYPLVTIDTLRSASDPRFKYTVFGGRVSAIIDFHLSWLQDAAIYDFSSWGDAVEDAIYSTMNDDVAFVGGNVVYNKDISVNRGPIQMAGQNWRQSLSCPCTFTVLTN